jgi:hypothetical protein
MEKLREVSNRARHRVKLADHMLTQTYLLVKDPKLLLAVIENTFLALTSAMGSVLHHERMYKRIPPFVDNFENKFDIFKRKCAERHNIDKEYLSMVREIKEIIVAHKTSPVEFARKDSFVICTENYRLKTITVDQLKKYIKKTKEFVQITENIVSQNGRNI